MQLIRDALTTNILAALAGVGADDDDDLALLAAPATRNREERPELACSASVAQSAGHSHTLTVRLSDLLEAEQLMYTTESARGHSHRIVLTAEHIWTLRAAGAVIVDSSSDDGHCHVVALAFD